MEAPGGGSPFSFTLPTLPSAWGPRTSLAHRPRSAGNRGSSNGSQEDTARAAGTPRLASGAGIAPPPGHKAGDSLPAEPTEGESSATPRVTASRAGSTVASGGGVEARTHPPPLPRNTTGAASSRGRRTRPPHRPPAGQQRQPTAVRGARDGLEQQFSPLPPSRGPGRGGRGGTRGRGNLAAGHGRRGGRGGGDPPLPGPLAAAPLPR